MMLHAIVPVKSLAQAKSRLAGTLTPNERRALMIEMLGRVVRVLRHPATPVTTTWLVSADPVALRLATSWGAQPLHEDASDLNSALTQARSCAFAHGAEAILVVPGDVPLITPADVAALAALLAHDTAVALAPDAAGHGTNALGLRRTAAIPFRFGPTSAAQHLAEAVARNLRIRWYHSPTLALDVDDPASLAQYRALVPPPTACVGGDWRL